MSFYTDYSEMFIVYPGKNCEGPHVQYITSITNIDQCYALCVTNPACAVFVTWNDVKTCWFKTSECLNDMRNHDGLIVHKKL